MLPDARWDYYLQLGTKKSPETILFRAIILLKIRDIVKK
jgi:hypothetical protein